MPSTEDVRQSFATNELEPQIESLTPLVRQMAARRTRCPGHRDDAQQRGMLGMLRAASKYDPSRGLPFEHYALAAARNEVSKAVQRLPSQEATGVDLPDLWVDERSCSPMLDALCDWLLKAPAKLRQVFEGLYVLGLSQRQLAARLGVSQPRVAALHRELMDSGRMAVLAVAN